MSDETVINVGQPAPKQDEVVTSNATETVIPTQREADLAAQTDINQAEQKQTMADTLAARSQRDAEQAKLDAIQADEDARASKMARLHEKEIKDQQARAGEAREHALSELEQARAKAAGMKMHDFFKDASTGKKLARALLMFGGGVAAGMQNAGAAYLGQTGNFHNQVADALNAAAERDFQAQRTDLENARDAAIQAGANIGHVDAVYKQHLLDLQAGQLAAKERLLAEAKATMTKAGLSAAAIDRRLALLADKFKMGKELEGYLTDQRHLETAKFQKKKAERQVMQYAPVPGVAGADASGPKNEQQAKAQTLGGAMAAGLQAISEALPSLSADDVKVLNGARAGMLNAITSGRMEDAFVKSDRQKIQNAVNEGRASPAALTYFDGLKQFVDNKLRNDSGGAISKDEANNELDKFMISSGEDPKAYSERLGRFAVPVTQSILAGGYKPGTNEKTGKALSEGLPGKGASAVPDKVREQAQAVLGDPDAPSALKEKARRALGK